MIRTILVSIFLTIGLNISAQVDAVHFLAPGDKAPSLAGYKKWIKGAPINEFIRGRIYIVELGATWCSPCAEAIPHLTALSQKYAKDVSVVSCFVMENNEEPDSTKNPLYVKRVEKYISRQGEKIAFNVCVDGPAKTLEKSWIKAAGKTGIPHIFIVDRNGVIAWIGSNPKPLDSLIAIVSKNDYSAGVLARKTDRVSFNVLASAGEIANEAIYFSMLSKYDDSTPPLENNPYIDNFRYSSDPELVRLRGIVRVQGESLRRLYYMAYGDTLWNHVQSMMMRTGVYPDTVKLPHQKRAYGNYWFRPILNLRDSSQFEVIYTKPENRYDYFLKVPLSKGSSATMQRHMQQDLQAYFGYRVTVEKRRMPCWKLVATDDAVGKLKTKTPGDKYRKYQDGDGNYVFKNADVRDVIHQLEMRYGYSTWGSLIDHPGYQPPFIDATGIKDKIDYVLDGKELDKINEVKSVDTFNDFRNLLKKTGFELRRGTRLMNVVVIGERSPSPVN